MTRNEFKNLKTGDLVVYRGQNNKNTVRIINKCTGLVLKVDKFMDIEDQYGNIKSYLRLIQPFVESDFEMFVSGWSSLAKYEETA